MARKIKIKSGPERRINWLKVLYYFLLLSFIGAIFHVLFFSRLLAINDISIVGTKNVPSEKIRDEIRTDLDGRYLGYIDKNNLILAKTVKMESQVKNDFKKIKNITIKRKFPSTLVVNVEERNPTLIVCSADRCFIVDENGQAFEETTTDSSDYQNENWMILRDASSISVDMGSNALEADLIKFLLGAREKFQNNLDINLDREAETPNRVSYDIRMKTKDGWKIYLNANLDVDKQTEALKTVLESKISKDNLSNLEYIDLRSDGKVFYKFKEGVQQEENSGEQVDVDNADQQPKSDKKKDSKKKG